MKIIKDIKQYFRLLFDGSFVCFLYDLPIHIKEFNMLRKIDFNILESYYQENRKRGDPEKNILFHVGSTVCCVSRIITKLLIEYKYASKTIALVNNWSWFGTKYLLKKYNIKSFVYVYTWQYIYYQIKGIKCFIKNIKNLTYREECGWHIFVDQIDVGDLIYDEFLRYTNMPMCYNLNLKYIFFIINRLSQYYRFKSIIRRYDITDIIADDIVYARSAGLIRAAASLDNSINVYHNMGSDNPFSISVRFASKGYIREGMVYEPSLIDELINKYGKMDLLAEYDIYMNKRMQGENSTTFDTGFVYKNTEINTQTDFIQNYQIHKYGKNIFIFSHAFVDAVRVSRVFYSDYYTWLYQTLLYLAEKSHEHNIYVKPHPSESLYRCDITLKSVVDEVNSKYNAEFIFLDKKVHNNTIFNLANSIVTAAGTIAIEAVPHLVPVLVASYPRYEKANIVIQPNNINEYKSFLDNVEDLPIPSLEMVERAKLCFMLYEKYFYTSASFLAKIDSVSIMQFGHNYDIRKLYSQLNSLYATEVPLNNEPLYKMFCYMIEKRHHDTIDLTDADK